MATLYASDSHFGLDVPDTEIIVDTVTKVVKEGKLNCKEALFAGDLMVNWYQQEHNPGWEQRIQTIAGEWINLLRERNSVLVAGNCEHKFEVDFLGMGELPFSHFNKKNGVFTTHGHIFDPSSAMELGLNLAPSLSQNNVRRAIERILRTGDESRFNTNEKTARLKQAIEKDPKLADLLEKLDTEQHQASVGQYLKIKAVLEKIPGAMDHFNKLMHASIDDYYVRTLIHSVRDLVESGDMEAPKTLLFGHTHVPFILNKAQLRRKFDFGDKWLPEFVVNSGTMVPITEFHGGTDESHFVMVNDKGVPMLYRTTEAPVIELVNVGGNSVSEKVQVD